LAPAAHLVDVVLHAAELAFEALELEGRIETGRELLGALGEIAEAALEVDLHLERGGAWRRDCGASAARGSSGCRRRRRVLLRLHQSDHAPAGHAGRSSSSRSESFAKYFALDSAEARIKLGRQLLLERPAAGSRLSFFASRIPRKRLTGFRYSRGETSAPMFGSSIISSACAITAATLSDSKPCPWARA